MYKNFKNHDWKVDYQQAVEIQNKLSKQVLQYTLQIDNIRYLASADISYNKDDTELYAAVLLFTFPERNIVTIQRCVTGCDFPYIPGLLSFREAPVLLSLITKLNKLPDVILIDGQGIAHPRGLGVASHIGVLLDLPTIGCAKKRLYGDYYSTPTKKGTWVPLMDGNKEIGRVVCTRSGVKPIFVSIGHRVDLDTAVQVVLSMVSRYRIPDPLREAHRVVNEMRKSRFRELSNSDE